MVKMKLVNLSALIIWGGLSLCGVPATAQSPEWIDGRRLVLQTLDKVTARIQTVDAEIGQAVRFGTLEITAHYCAYRPPEQPPDHTAFLQIRDIALNLDRRTTSKSLSLAESASASADAEQPVFSGWMFASSPALSGLEHPVYDVTLLSCSK